MEVAKYSPSQDTFSVVRISSTNCDSTGRIRMISDWLIRDEILRSWVGTFMNEHQPRRAATCPLLRCCLGDVKWHLRIRKCQKRKPSMPTRGISSSHIDVDNGPQVPEIWLPCDQARTVAHIQFRTTNFFYW